MPIRPPMALHCMSSFGTMTETKRTDLMIDRRQIEATERVIRLSVTGERYADALAASEACVRETGALAVHAYDQLETLLGQGTIGKELSVQAPTLDTLLVAVGGGGLIGGIAAWYAGDVKVIGVE